MAHLFLLSAPFDESRYTHSLPTFLFINRIYVVARMIGVKRVTRKHPSIEALRLAFIDIRSR